MRFVGRRADLAALEGCFEQVVTEHRGVMLAVRGRRQVGKSRLFTEFIERNRLPYLFTTAVKNGPLDAQMEAFRRDCGESAATLAGGDRLLDDPPTTWVSMFARLREVAVSGPLVVVLDEFPWACEGSPTLEGELQRAWDRHLQHLPILLVLVGSDIAMMQRLTEHDRPLYGRAREWVLRPFNPAEIAEAVGSRGAMAAFDAYLTTGGYPKLVEELLRHGTAHAYIRSGLQDENTDLVVVAQRSLDAEFAAEAQARHVLSAIGGHDVGHPTFTSVVGSLGDNRTTSGVALTRAIRTLADKGVLAIESPAGAKPNTKQRRYRVADPYLRFWFRFVGPQLANIARGRGDVAVAAYESSWSAWRGIAVEPIVRDAINRLAPSIPGIEDVTDVGPWWMRDNGTEVDIVASGRNGVEALGSIKWRDRRPFSASELRTLQQARSVVPHAGAARLVVACPAGADAAGRAGAAVAADVVLTADDLLAAWH